MGKQKLVVRDGSITQQKRGAPSSEGQQAKRTKPLPANVAEIVTPLWQYILLDR